MPSRMKLTKIPVLLHYFSKIMGILLFVLKYMYISLLLKMINGFSWPAKIMASPFNAKLLIWRLPSLSVPNITSSLTQVTKLHQTWQTRLVLKTQTVAWSHKKCVLPFSRELKSRTHLVNRVVKHKATIIWADRTEWSRQILRYNNITHIGPTHLHTWP